ncbi:MAG: DNA-formamidopyrimidine glycosylase family protein [Actinomycetota bacterium]
MPEGDTVWLAAHNLRSVLAGRELTRTDFRVPRYATTDLSRRSVLDVVARGKHLLWRLEGELTVHSHFKLDGAWHLYRRGQRWRAPAHEARVVMETEKWRAVGFRLPVLEVMPTEREPDVVGQLGPDLLGDDWEPVEAAARLRARAHTAIGEALLDQTVVTGLGNVYVYGRRGKPCFRCGLPVRKAHQASYGSERIVYWCPSCQPSQERKGKR